jgi:hypothetical protein
LGSDLCAFVPWLSVPESSLIPEVEIPEVEIPEADGEVKAFDFGAAACSALSTKARRSLIRVPVYKSNSPRLDLKQSRSVGKKGGGGF